MLCTPRSYTSWRRTFPWGKSSSAWAGPILPVPSQQPRRCWTPFRTSRRQKARALSAATTSRKEAAACGCRVATIFTVHASHPGSAATPPAQPAVQRWAMRHLPRLALRPNLTPPAQRQRPRSPLLPTTSSRRCLHVCPPRARGRELAAIWATACRCSRTSSSSNPHPLPTARVSPRYEGEAHFGERSSNESETIGW